MNFTEHITPSEHVTITVRIDLFGAEHSATLSGRFRYAVLDGLLWWTLNRYMGAFVAHCMPMVHHADMEQASALHDGEALVHYVYTAPFAEADDARALRIMAFIGRHLPTLAVLATTPELVALHDRMLLLAETLKDRLDHPGEALHGVEGILKHQDAA